MLHFAGNAHHVLADMMGMTEDIPSLTLKILQDLRAEMRTTNTRLESLETRFMSLETRFASLEHTTALGFERVTERLEHLRDFAGERYRDHEERISKLEARLEPR